jgi:CheY-like chemotaxis protein
MSQNAQLILMADDDRDDCELTREALKEACPTKKLHCVHDGVELLDYLKRVGNYKNNASDDWPTLILLDLNMPKLDGYGALKALKSDENLAAIPVLIVTTSAALSDIENAYRYGAQSYIVKPSSYKEYVEKLRISNAFWFDVATIPQLES